MAFLDAFRRPPPVVERGGVGPDFGTGDGALAEFLGWSGVNDSDVAVNEWTALGSSAVWRAVNIIAGLAQLPLYAARTPDNDEMTVESRVPSILDNPGGAWFTPYEWRETVYAHLALHGNAYLLRVYNGMGQLVALFPIHPTMVQVRWFEQRRLYTVTIPAESPLGQSTNPTFQYTEDQIVHVRGLSGDGLKGYSPIWMLRNTVGTGLSGDKAAARAFRNGMLLGGIVSAPGITPEQGKQIKAGLKANLAGAANAGDLAVVNAALTFSPWTMSAVDGQFLESRAFQVEEVARAWGIPKALLAEDGASTWGAGLMQLDNGMAKYTFGAYTKRLENKLDHSVLNGLYAVTDYSAFLRGTPQEQAQVKLTLAQAEYYAGRNAATEAASESPGSGAPPAGESTSNGGNN